MTSTALQNSELPASHGNCQSTDKKDGAQRDEMSWVRVQGPLVWDLARHPECESAQASQPLVCNELTFVLSTSKHHDVL